MGRLLVTALMLIPVAAAEDAYRAARERMVERQIEARGITDARILDAMRTTPRHEFVPEAMAAQAYSDHPLPIGYRQTISQPYIVAFMTEKLDVRKEHKVLEIGTGSGYQAAILAPLAGQVYTIEIVPELARSAKGKLARYKNVTVREGDGYEGWPDEAPFDRIILTAAPPELPETLVEQLAPEGRLIAPVGGSPWTQKLVLVEKDRKGRVTERSILPVVFVPMVRGGER